MTNEDPSEFDYEAVDADLAATPPLPHHGHGAARTHAEMLVHCYAGVARRRSEVNLGLCYIAADGPTDLPSPWVVAKEAAAQVEPSGECSTVLVARVEHPEGHSAEAYVTELYDRDGYRVWLDVRGAGADVVRWLLHRADIAAASEAPVDALNELRARSKRGVPGGIRKRWLANCKDCPATVELDWAGDLTPAKEKLKAEGWSTPPDGQWRCPTCGTEDAEVTLSGELATTEEGS